MNYFRRLGFDLARATKCTRTWNQTPSSTQQKEIARVSILWLPQFSPYARHSQVTEKEEEKSSIAGKRRRRRGNLEGFGRSVEKKKPLNLKSLGNTHLLEHREFVYEKEK